MIDHQRRTVLPLVCVPFETYIVGSFLSDCGAVGWGYPLGIDFQTALRVVCDQLQPQGLGIRGRSVSLCLGHKQPQVLPLPLGRIWILLSG